jgi:hypothetical protein
MALLPLIYILSSAPAALQVVAPPTAALQSAARSSGAAGSLDPAATPAVTASGENPQAVQDPDGVVLEDVVVVGPRRGAAALAPEIELDATEIDNLGAYDIGEALGRLSEGLGFDETPVIIVNGRPVTNARDFLRFPPDALVRVEVLPQQAASLYGEAPSRRVLNIVLQPRFTSRDGFVRASAPTQGGNSSLGLDVRQSEIVESDTRQFGVQLTRDTSLRADERPDYLRDHPESAVVTLRPAADAVTANFAMTKALGDWSSSLSGDARAQRSRFMSRVGTETVETRRSVDSLGLSGGVTGDAAGWSVQLGLTGGISDAEQGGIAGSRSRNLSMGADVKATRPLIELAAGPVVTTLAARYGRSRVTRDGADPRSNQALDLRGNLAIPLSKASSPGEGGGPSLGDLSLTLGVTADGFYDDSGRGDGLNLGLTWAPVRKLRFNGLWSRSTDNPSSSQRFDPVYFGPPRVVFDFQTGESVEVLPILGGNPDLRGQTLERLSLSASAGPFTAWGVRGRIGFQRNSSTDGIGPVPELTPAVEAALPDLFIRDAGGRLVNIDQRSINIGSTLAETLTSGLNFSLPLGGGGGRAGAPSLQFGINHTWQLTSTASLHPGLPELDRLAGDGGGAPRHQINVQVDGRRGNWGLNAGARWQSASRIRRDIGADGPNDIERSAFAAIDLKISYLLERTAPAARDGARPRRDGGVRLELQIDNLFDARPEATRGDGRPVPGYGRDDQDPLGRVVRLTLSRRF